MWHAKNMTCAADPSPGWYLTLPQPCSVRRGAKRKLMSRCSMSIIITLPTSKSGY
ncbi:unnamed protein product [Musa acuminata subsp. malaccensis]|uniref:(wild Malaysian banana) hypothetical protein n=1 Tax=Musa acuminata subsp. malaccensis TaxID=214687 RepID=A0A804HYT1_MUSAM|nr:unnamed protein product [Musa acuminata subsp. malaccensis]